MENTLQEFLELGEANEAQEAFVRELLLANKWLKRNSERQQESKKKKAESLELGFNKHFLQGKDNQKVSIKYAREIMIYLCMKQIAKSDALSKHGTNKTFPFLYKTDGKRFAEQFNLSRDPARDILKTLEEMGAIVEIRKESKKLRTYKLGERKRVKTDKGMMFIDSWLFKMGKVYGTKHFTKTHEWYREQKKRMKNED